MKKSILILICLLTTPYLWAQNYTYEHLEVQFDETSTSSKLSPHITYKNLRLYPIRAKQSFLNQVKNLGKYTTLRQALANETVVITERESSDNSSQLEENTNEENINVTQQVVQQQRIGDGATVNQLFIENISKDTVYIMAGDIVQGGKQDRVIAQDIMLAPNSGVVNLSVFCVEQGRWKYKGGDNAGFKEYYGQSSLKMRGVVDQKQNQGEVWDEVKRSNKANMVSSSTGAYTAQKSSKQFSKQLNEYTTHFTKAFQQHKNIIGVLVVTGDRIVGCDMFASPQIFESQFESLITAYASEAITDGASVKISEQTAQSYMDNLLKNEALQKKFIKEKGKMFENQNRKLRISTY